MPEQLTTEKKYIFMGLLVIYTFYICILYCFDLIIKT